MHRLLGKRVFDVFYYFGQRAIEGVLRHRLF